MAVRRLVLAAAVAATLCLVEGRPQNGEDRLETLHVRPFSQSDRRHGHEGVQQSFNQPVRPFNQAEDIPQGLSARPFNQREGSQDNLPVRPFDQYDSRVSSGSPRIVPPQASQPLRPFSTLESAGTSGGSQTSRREEDPFQSRAHSSPLNPRITLQSEQDRQQQRANHHPSSQHTPATSAPQRKDESPNWTSGQVRLEPKTGQGTSSTPLLRDNRKANPQEPAGKAGSRGHQQQGRGSTLRMGTVGAPVQQGKSDSDQEGIVFPGPTKEVKLTTRRFTPQVSTMGPNCAEGSTFCESTDNYPSEYLKTILTNEVEGLKELFGNDLLLNDSSVVQRIDSEDENPLCHSLEQVVYPKMAQNKENKWLYVVNQDQYIQGVRVEKCSNPGSECPYSNSFPLGYKTACRQKYIYRRMLALNDDGKTLTDTFRLPSCCSCFVKTESGSGRKR